MRDSSVCTLKTQRAAAWISTLVSTLLSSSGWAAEKNFVVTGASSEASLGLKIAFGVFAGLAILCGAATVTRRRPMVAALFLVATLAATAGLYLLLHATFLAAVQVLVYAGAIMVLFLFVIMSVEGPEQEEHQWLQTPFVRLTGIACAALLAWRLIYVLCGPRLLRASPVPAHFGSLEDVGRLLFSEYLFPFEAISLLLLTAIVGAVVITRRQKVTASESESTEQGRPS